MIMENFWRDAQKLPNIITLTRLLFGAPATIILYKNGFEYTWLVFVLFAALDWLDGKIARKTNTVTSLGMRLDPLADQFLVLPVTWYLVYVSVLHATFPLILTLREIIMIFMRAVASRNIPAILSGKLKINAWYISIACVLFGGQLYFFGFIFLALAVVFSLWSFGKYCGL